MMRQYELEFIFIFSLIFVLFIFTVKSILLSIFDYLFSVSKNKKSGRDLEYFRGYYDGSHYLRDSFVWDPSEFDKDFSVALSRVLIIPGIFKPYTAEYELGFKDGWCDARRSKNSDAQSSIKTTDTLIDSEIFIGQIYFYFLLLALCFVINYVYIDLCANTANKTITTQELRIGVNILFVVLLFMAVIIVYIMFIA
jgi:hypothetical protein